MEPTDNSVHVQPSPTKPKQDQNLWNIIEEWNKYKRSGVKKKYFDYEVIESVKTAKCNRFRIAGDGRRVQCDAKFRNPSSTTLLRHLATHPDLQEFGELRTLTTDKTVQTKLIQENGKIPDFEECALMMILETNSSWHLLDNPHWATICMKYLCRSHSFGSQAAKMLMKSKNEKIKEKCMVVFRRIPYFSISEDEGTVGGTTKVLHNLHFFDPVEWKYRTLFLRYFETENKEADTLIAHWRETLAAWNIDLKSIAAFVSDAALDYVPRGMSKPHNPCGTHFFDLCLEDHYKPTSGHGIEEEVDKFVEVRKYLTQTTRVEKQYFAAQERRNSGKSTPFPINSMVRFVTHQAAFDHIHQNWRSCNEVAEHNTKLELILTESEVTTARGASLVFKVVHAYMIQMQAAGCCLYLMILWGCHQRLHSLKDLYASTFTERTGQEYLRVGTMNSILLRATTSQLVDDTRKLLVRAMIMEPYLKGVIDQKTTGVASKIFPEWIKMRYVEDRKKELVKELEYIIENDHVAIDGDESGDSSHDEGSSEEEKQKRKKKKMNLTSDLFNFMDDEIERSTSDSDNTTSRSTKKNEQLNWFKKNYLDTNLSCKSEDASEVFWKEKRKTHPMVIKLLCKYRSIACTSIFEESCFSTINKIFTDDRESLLDGTIEAMMQCKKNWSFLFE
jgi:hypothetical protein